jgi:outer membrane receptor protein involved in Fe transport
MRKRTHVIAALLAGAAVLGGPITAWTKSEASFAFDLPAQEMGDALRAVAARAGLELYAPAQDVNGIAAPRLQGTLSPRQAIEQLLRGTGLTARFSDGAVVIRGRDPASEALAGDASNSEIVVTGTRIRGAVPSAPVRTTKRADIEAEGHRDLGDFIRSIPQNFSGGQNPGVAGGGDQGLGNENDSSSSALNLRGLGPAATLTLLNGHRLAYDTVAQGVDISQIPLAAIDRVEIVTDGSSALYGSDAVGGVANVILRRDYQGVLASARLGGSTEGGNTQQQYDLLTGTRWSGGGVMVAGSYSNVSAITARQRDYTRNLDDSSTLVPWQRQYSLITAGHQDLTDRLRIEFDAQYNKRLTELAAPFLTTSDVTTNGLLTRPNVQSATGSASLHWDLGGSWTVSATGVYGFSDNHILSRRYASGVETLRSWLNYDNDVATGEVGAEGVLLKLPGGDVRLAVGGGYRHNGLDILVRQQSSGISTIRTNITSGRDVWFGYGELSVPLVGNANRMPLIDRLQLDLAARYEDYPGSAQLVTPKVGILYRPDPAVTISANWGKSFKTQTLYQQYQLRQGALLPAAIFPGAPSALPVLILAGGNANLKPEKATTWNLGIKIAPAALPGLDLEATWFDIRYRDRVVSPVTSLLAAFTNPIYAAYVTTAPSASAVTAVVADLPQGLSNQTGAPFDPAGVGAIIDSSLQNAARQHVRGLDFAARYRIELGRDNFVRLEGSASYLKSDQQLSAGFPLQQMAGLIFNPPHWRGRLGGTWRQDNVTFSAYGSYIGGTTDNRYTPDEHVGSFKTLDLVGQLRSQPRNGAGSGMTLTLSVQNLFDAGPDVIRNAIPTDPPYDSTNYPVAGRVISIAIAKAF